MSAVTRIKEFLALAEKAVVVGHVKWKKAHDAGLIYPAADTDKFESLLKLNRGTLVFIPASEDYGPQREEEVRTEGEWCARKLLEAVELLEREVQTHKAARGCDICKFLNALERSS